MTIAGGVILGVVGLAALVLLAVTLLVVGKRFIAKVRYLWWYMMMS